MSHSFPVKAGIVVLFSALIACNNIGATQDLTGPNSRPNILVLIADDAGWKDFGCYGHPTIKTPNIDKLAEMGLKFNNAFLTTSSCSPSRTSILAGKYAHSIGTEDMHVPLPDSVNFLPHYLRADGYFTGNMLKTHYGPNGEKQFDWYSNKLQDFGKFLDSAGDAPFFMWTGFKDPHRPYDLNQYKIPFDPAKVVVPSYMVDTHETRQDLANYYSEIMRLDEHIGWMIAELKKRNLDDNTLVIFLSDNGAPFPRAKGTLYDSGIGTPFIFNWPRKISGGRVYNDLISAIDLAPTVLEIAGIDSPSDMQGKSLVPVIEDKEGFSRPFAFSERNWHGADEHIRSVRNLRYKLITNEFEDVPFGSPSDIVESDSWQDLYRRKQSGNLTGVQGMLFRHPRPAREFYDLKTDPDETKNLADDPRYAEVVAQFDSALQEWQRVTNDVREDQHPKEDKTNRFTGERIVASDSK